jgi:hypothetical protein
MGEVRENRILAGTSVGEVFCGIPVAGWRRNRVWQWGLGPTEAEEGTVLCFWNMIMGLSDFLKCGWFLIRPSNDDVFMKGPAPLICPARCFISGKCASYKITFACKLIRRLSV